MRNDELMHYGILGMKWGVRRYQPYGQGGYDPKHKGRFIGKMLGIPSREERKEMARKHTAESIRKTLGVPSREEQKEMNKKQPGHRPTIQEEIEKIEKGPGHRPTLKEELYKDKHKYDVPYGARSIAGDQKKPSQKEYIKKMSDVELDTAIRRLQKEHQYRDLLMDDIGVGEKIARGVLLTTGTVGVAIGANYVASKINPKLKKDGRALAAAALATFGAVTIDSFADKMGKAATAKTIKDAFGGDVFKATYPKK